MGRRRWQRSFKMEKGESFRCLSFFEVSYLFILTLFFGPSFSLHSKVDYMSEKRGCEHSIRKRVELKSEETKRERGEKKWRESKPLNVFMVHFVNLTWLIWKLIEFCRVHVHGVEIEMQRRSSSFFVHRLYFSIFLKSFDFPTWYYWKSVSSLRVKFVLVLEDKKVAASVCNISELHLVRGSPIQENYC